MRATSAIAFTLLIFGGVNGSGFLDSLSSAFGGLGTSLHSVFDPVLSTALDAGKQIGANILTQAQQAGSLLLSQAAQNVLSVLQPTATPPPPLPVSEITTPHPDLIPSDAKRKTNNVYETMMTIVKKANDLLQDEAKELKQCVEKTVMNFRAVLHSYAEGGITDVHTVLDRIQRVVDIHKKYMENYKERISVRAFQNMTLGLEDTLGKFFPIQGRSQILSELFSKASHQIASFFSPHIKSIDGLVDILGRSLKEAVTQVDKSLQNMSGDKEAAIATFQKTSATIMNNLAKKMKMQLSNIIQK